MKRNPQLERAYANRRMLPPGARREIEAAYEEYQRQMTPERGPESLDANEAAAAPIEVEGEAGRTRLRIPPFSYEEYRSQKQRAEHPQIFGPGHEMPLDNFENEGEVRRSYERKYGEGSYDRDRQMVDYLRGPNAPWWARSGRDALRAANGQTPRQGSAVPPGYAEFAAGMAEAETGRSKAQRAADAEDTIRRWDRQKEAYDRATGLTAGESAADETGPYPGAGRPGYDRTFTPRELADQRASRTSGAPITETVPGPRGIGGAAVRPPKPIYDEEEAASYTERPFDTNTGKYKPSKKDRDMMERGLVPVLNEDGTVGYSVGYDVDPLAPGIPGGPGRAGQRVDLEGAGWGATLVEGPTGPVRVYQPGPDAKKRYKAQADDRTRVRLAKRAGISGSEAMGMDVDELRTRAKAAGIDDYNARNSAWKAQSMLAGGQPTGGPRGTKAATNALMMLPEEWRSAVLAKGLRPDLDGTTPLTVEANSAKNAMRLLNAEVLGQGGMGDMRAQMRKDQMRQQAYDFAKHEHDQLFGAVNGAMGPEDARRLKRRVAARFGPEYADVVDALPISETRPAPAPPPTSSGPPVPPPAPGPMNGLPRFGS